jgi:hypothetical protein
LDVESCFWLSGTAKCSAIEDRWLGSCPKEMLNFEKITQATARQEWYRFITKRKIQCD